MAQSSGFDVSRMSTATKILLGGGILFLIDSFLPWQQVCPEFAGVSLGCVSANMWGGSGSFAGLIAGLLVIALIVWEALALANVNVEVGMDRSKLSAFLGFGVLAFALLKFIIVLTNQAGFGAWIGLVLALAIGYGAWMRFQEPEAAAPPPPPATNGGTTT